MASSLILGGALANCGRDAPTDDFLQFLLHETQDLSVFRYRPLPRPGMSIKAALDWQAVLGTAADVLALASVLWAAYEKFVKPKIDQKSAGLKPFLFINLRRPDGAFTQFSIGEAEKDKQVFIEHFTKQVTELRTLPSDDGDVDVHSVISQNEEWVRVSVKDRDS